MSQNFYSNLVYENPFTQCTGRDMSYREVLDFWCNPFGSFGSGSFGFSENDLFSLKTPIIFEGARGTGKTMILKYLSYYCQKEYAAAEDLLEFVKSKKSVGIYFRYKVDYVNLFSQLNLPEHVKECIFLNYFELMVSTELVDVLSDIIRYSVIDEFELSALSKCLSDLFSCRITSLADVSEHMHVEINVLDTWLKTFRYREDSHEEILKVCKQGIIANLVNILCKCISKLKNVTFMIIVDEYENAKDYQKIVNTLIKKVDSETNLTYRIGIRTEGMMTYETMYGEDLQVSRDFLSAKLVFDSIRTYKNFLKHIAQRRLESVHFYKSNRLTDIEQILGKREDIVEEVLEVMNNSSLNKRRHFDPLKKLLPQSEYDYALKALSSSNPLLEMLNVVWVIRGVSVETTAKSMYEYESGNSKKTSKYRRDYVDKYKYHLAFLLLNAYKGNQKVKKYYYSFNTFAFLSSGSVNDFISLCRNTFYLLDENYFINISTKPTIPKELQTNGAAKTAIEQLGKIKENNEFGTQMYTFVMNIGNLFTEYHKDIHAKYPETNQFAFDNEASIDSKTHLKLILKSLLKWGAIVKKQSPQRLSVGRSKKGSVYYLNHIFAPIFNISYRIRGGYNPILTESLFESMLYESMDSIRMLKLVEPSKGRKIKSKSIVRSRRKSSYEQLSFFEE